MERNRERRVIMSMVEFVFLEVLLVTQCGFSVPRCRSFLLRWCMH